MYMIKILSVVGIIVELIGVFIIAKIDLFTDEEKIYKTLRGAMGNRIASRDPNINLLLDEMKKRAFNTKVGFICVLVGVIIQLISQYLSS